MTVVVGEPRPGQLLHILGVGFGVAVGVGMMIGSGILRSPSLVATHVPNATWIVGLWALGAFHAALGANIFAELATALPKAGGSYVYAHRALGDVCGLIVGWTNWLATLVGIASASVLFANFLGQIWSPALDYAAPIAVATQAAIFGANMAGLREGRLLQLGTTLVKCLMLAAFIVAAVSVGVGMSAAPAPSPIAPVIGVTALIGAYQLIRGAYAGWEAPVYFTEENAAPSRSIPRALLYGLLLTAILYIGVNAALLWTLGVTGTARSVLPFTTVLMRMGGTLPSVLFALGAMVTVASCANANIMSAPRILFALSRDRLLPPILQNVNAGGSPVLAFAMSAAFSVVLAATARDFEQIFGMIATLNSLGGILVGLSIFVLRAREPDLARPFRAILYPVAPAIAVAIDTVLLILFLRANITGAYVAIGLSLACIPFALIARRSRG